jgi:hypothetical protein
MELVLTSLNCTFPASPSSATDEYAASGWMKSWQRDIFSLRKNDPMLTVGILTPPARESERDRLMKSKSLSVGSFQPDWRSMPGLSNSHRFTRQSYWLSDVSVLVMVVYRESWTVRKEEDMIFPKELYRYVPEESREKLVQLHDFRLDSEMLTLYTSSSLTHSLARSLSGLALAHSGP